MATNDSVATCDLRQASTHSPGPWTLQRLETARHDYPTWNTFCVRANNNVHLATVGEVDRYYEEQNEANARLTVASPDLLEACEALLQIVSFQKPTGITAAALVMAQAAIAKARGDR